MLAKGFLGFASWASFSENAFWRSMAPWLAFSLVEESLLEHLESLQPQPAPHCAPEPLHSHLLVLHDEDFEHEQPSDGIFLGRMHFSSEGFSRFCIVCILTIQVRGYETRLCALWLIKEVNKLGTLSNASKFDQYANATWNYQFLICYSKMINI